MYANEDSTHHCVQYVVSKETAGKLESFNIKIKIYCKSIVLINLL